MTSEQRKNECAERNYIFQYLIPNFPYQEDKMGISKRRLEEEEYKESIARAIALESGAIKECEFHPGTYIDQSGPDTQITAYKIANSRFTRGDEEIIDSFESRTELTDMIKGVIDESGDECYSCKKMDDE